jgi:putative component of toxin-antitoxin plasmid stabilization module
MRFRTFWEPVGKQGGELCRWLGHNMDAKERGRFEARLQRMESEETLNQAWWKRYKSIHLWELRFDVGNKAYRFLAHQIGANIYVLIPVKKKGAIPASDEERAAKLKKQLEEGKLDVRIYPLATRE